MLLMYYNIKVKSLCVWGSQNLSSDKYVPRYLIHQRLSVTKNLEKKFWKKNFGKILFSYPHLII